MPADKLRTAAEVEPATQVHAGTSLAQVLSSAEMPSGGHLICPDSGPTIGTTKENDR